MEELDFIIYGVKNKYNRKYKRMESSINNEIAARNKFLGQLEGVLKELMGQRKTLTNADMLDIEIKEIEPAIDEIEREIGVQKLELSELEERKSKIVFKEGVIPPPPLQPPSNTTLPGNIPVEPLPEDKKINLGQENLPREDDDEEEEERDYTEKDLVECLRRIIGFGWVNYIKSYTYDRELELKEGRARGEEEGEPIDLSRIQRKELEREFSYLDREIEKYSKLSKEDIERNKVAFREEREKIVDKIKKLLKFSEEIFKWLSSNSSEVVEDFKYKLNDIKRKINELREKLKEKLGISIASTPKGIKDLKSSEVTGLIDERIATLFLRYLRTDYAKDHPEEFDIYIRNSNDEDIIREICNDRENKILVWYREGVEKIIDLIVKNKQYYFCRLYLELKEMTKLLREGDPEDRLKLEGSITRGIIGFGKAFNRFFDDSTYPVKLIEETEKKIKDSREFVEYVYGLVSKVKGFYTNTVVNYIEIKNFLMDFYQKNKGEIDFTSNEKKERINPIITELTKQPYDDTEDNRKRYISGLKELEEALLESQSLRFSIRALKELELEEKRYREEIVKFSTSTYQNLRLLEQIGRDIQEKVKSIRRSVQVYGKFVPNKDYIETKFLEKVREILEINVGKIPELKSRFLDYGVTDSDPKRREEKRTKLKQSFDSRLKKYKEAIKKISDLILSIYTNVGVNMEGNIIEFNQLIDLLFKYTGIGSPDECEELISGETERKSVTKIQKYFRRLLGRREFKRLQAEAILLKTRDEKREKKKVQFKEGVEVRKFEIQSEEDEAAAAAEAAAEAAAAGEGGGETEAAASTEEPKKIELSDWTRELFKDIRTKLDETTGQKITEASEEVKEAEADLQKATEAKTAEVADLQKATEAKKAADEAEAKAAAAKAKDGRPDLKAKLKAAAVQTAAEARVTEAREKLKAVQTAAEAEKQELYEKFCDIIEKKLTELKQGKRVAKEKNILDDLGLDTSSLLSILSDVIVQGCKSEQIQSVIKAILRTKGKAKGKKEYDFSMLKPWLGTPENKQRAAKIYERMKTPLKGEDFGNFGKGFIKLYQRNERERKISLDILENLLAIQRVGDYKKLNEEKKTSIQDLIKHILEGKFGNFSEKVEVPYQKILDTLYPPVNSKDRLGEKAAAAAEGGDKIIVVEEEIRVSNIEKNTPFRNPYFLSPDDRTKLAESGVSKGFLQFSSIINFKLTGDKFPPGTETFNWIKIAGDGACLFNSVVQFIFGSHFDDISQKLRKKVVDKAITTSRDFIIGEYDTPEAYKEIMGKRSTFAGDIEINGLMAFLNDKTALNEFIEDSPLGRLPRFKPGKETKIYVITPDIRGNLEWYGLFKPDDVMTGNDINRIFIFYNGYSHFELLLQGNLTEEGGEEVAGGGAKSPLKLKNPKSKFLSPSSKIKKERKKKKDKINKLKNKKNIKKGEPKK
tara:strand:- start:46 stop:4347 length:4302 start_codon:yes stop_codon:yes gene_type:complete